MVEKLIIKTFVKNLEYLMKRDNVDKHALAEALGMQPQNIHYYLNGNGLPKNDKWFKMTNKFNVSLDDLYYKDLAKEAKRGNKVEEPGIAYGIDPIEQAIKSQLNPMKKVVKDLTVQIEKLEEHIIFIYESRKRGQ